MPLYLGIPFTILILVVASQARIGNITLEWVAAALAGLWSAMQSRKYMLQRFERVFPLEPLALGITVTLLFPFAFPWFLRLRHRALRGRLPLRTRPSRLRIVLLVLVIGGGLLMQVGYSLLRRSAPWKGIESSLNTVETLAGGPIEYRVANDMRHHADHKERQDQRTVHANIVNDREHRPERGHGQQQAPQAKARRPQTRAAIFRGLVNTHLSSAICHSPFAIDP